MVLCLCGFAVTSCNITKFLEEDELVVDEVKIDVNADVRTTEIGGLKDELSNFHQIEPNKNWRSYNYFKYKDIEDPPWIRRWLKNKHSESPSLLDTSKVENTVTAMTKYLRNKKGFYQAEVDYEIKNNVGSQRSVVKYKVDTGPRYTINSVHHISKDSSITALLRLIAIKSLVRKGGPIEALTFDLEKQRIVTEIQKNGYADFNLTHIEIQGDSTNLDNSWDIFFMVMPPSDGISHTKFKIGDLNVFTDHRQGQLESNLTNEIRFGKNYLRESKDFVVRPSVIERKLYLNKYDTYDADDYYKTIRSLFSLGTYKLARLTPQVNERDSTLIDYDIFLTPHNNKWILDTGIESFFSNISLLNRNLVGIAARGGLEDRNAFGGSEIFKTSLELGVEFEPSTLEVNTMSVGFNNNIQIPTLTKPLNVLRPLHKVGAITASGMSKLQDEGKSNISLGFRYQDNLQLFKLFTIQAAYGYDFVLNSKNRFTFNQIGINYTTYDIPPDGRFQAILAQNEVLRRSFQNSLFTGFLFKDLTYYFQTDRGNNRPNVVLISQLELSGLEVSLANSVVNSITGNNKKWTVAGVDFERLAKLEFDLRWYQKPRPRSQLVARFKTGIAIPLDAANPVSFIKQYSIGGPSSVRAWRPMHVGPGSFLNRGAGFFNPPRSTIFYQRGDVLLDMSMEYRFDLFWLMKGALFVDAGNIWTIKDDDQRPGAKLGSDFLTNLAIGYGYGIRFDFTYFIIRFDLGFKLRYPSYTDSDGKPFTVVNPDGSSNTLSSHWTGPKGQKLGNFNIAINYPF